MPSRKAREADWMRINKVLHGVLPDGRTCDELEVILTMPHQTCSARLTEMRRKNWVRIIGWRYTRQGAKADVLCFHREEKAAE